MSKTRVFVSSTFFDLEQVREDIRATLISVGHDPILNEYVSFPIAPDISTIKNCKAAVRSCDLFVLIVGGRRGSLDPASGKPITNIEYETARNNGIGCFIFVNSAVMTLLPVWRKNPDADLTPVVDDPHVFKFIDEISTDQRWIFKFSRASEISDTLRTQLSVLLKSLLAQKTTGRLTPLKEFVSESQKAQEIAAERPRFWEYTLTAELLRTKLQTLKQRYRDFENGLIYRAATRVNAQTYFELISTKMGDFSKLMEIAKKSIQDELIESWGPPGQPGDPASILRTVNRIVGTCESFLDAEVDLDALEPPDELAKVAQTLKGMTLGVLEEFSRLPNELEAAIQGTWEGTRNVTIQLKFEAPPQLKAFTAEIEYLQGRGWESA